MTGRTYTHPDVFTLGVPEGWAEAETDPARIDWAERQARAAIPYEVIGGRPVNPCETTAVRYGRNEMGFWGENLMADALATLTNHWTGTRFLLLIERGDGYGWAVPGGHVEPGETGTEAALRELAEETGLSVPGDRARPMEPRYVYDPRSSGEAWAVTLPVHADLGSFRNGVPAVRGADDARSASWFLAGSYNELCGDLERDFGSLRGRLFAAHAGMLADFLGTEAE